jgi:hypothetical protein
MTHALLPAVELIQHTSTLGGNRIGVTRLSTTVACVAAVVYANQKTVVPVPQVVPVPYFNVL